MHRIKWYRSTPFRMALLAESIFVTAFLVIFGLLIFEMEGEFYEQQELALQNEYAFLNQVYVQGGVWATVAAVERNTRANVDGHKIYLLTDRTGQKLAGNIDTDDLPEEWTLIKSLFELDVGERFHSAVFTIGSMQLLIGVNGFELSEVINTALYTLIWSGLAVLLLAITAGNVVANRMSRRLKHISDVLSDIAKGEMDSRISFKNMSDDIGIMAEQINAALSNLEAHINSVKQVSADIAHDLRTPLTRLDILISTLDHRCREDGVVYEEFEQIAKQTQQINTIFDALLRLTDIEKGNVRDSFEPVDLQRLCTELFETYQPVCQDNEQALAYRCDTPISPVMGNHALIFQMLANLIENAVQHCPKNTQIELHLVDHVVTVADNGPGIPDTEQEKVFQRLYRLDRSRNTRGSGLGLNFVKAIARVHEAQVGIQNNHPGLLVAITFPK